MLLVALVAAGAALRLAALGATGLTVREAGQAFAAWAVAQGARPPQWVGDATSVLTSYLFRLGADGDAWPRLVSGLAGAALVPAAYLLARPEGRTVALLASFLVAFSPLTVAASRTALPGALGGLLAALLAAALLRHWQRPRPQTLWATVLLAALCLGSDAVGLAGLLGCLLFLALAVWTGDHRWPSVVESLRRWPWAVVLGLAPGLAISAIHWGYGPSGALAAPRLWSDLFVLPGDRSPVLTLLALLAYDWPLTFLGLGGAALLLRRAWLARGLDSLSPWERLSLCWLAPGLLVALAGSHAHEGALLAVALPLALLGAVAMSWALVALPWGEAGRAWPAAVLVVACSGALGLLWTLWSRPFSQVSAAEAWGAWLAAVSLMWGLWLAWRRWGTAAAAATALALAPLALGFWPHTVWAVGFHQGAEPLLGARFTVGRDQLARILPQMPAPAAPLALSLGVAEVLGWHLRHLPLAVGDPPPRSGVYIAEATSPVPRGFSPRGEPVTVAREWRWHGDDGRRFWRWLLLREPYGRVLELRVQTMVRTQ
ncbi:MAG TPA: glycosyltransferase family 39 protein [Dehalococcoidia bacterium]|nr:glycosyltransferase family 39 protein [Dehalococcoidia bacterium]